MTGGFLLDTALQTQQSFDWALAEINLLRARRLSAQASAQEFILMEVFISYSREVRHLVAPIAAGLEELGVDVWYDRELSAGERFGAVIRTRLKEAKAVIACWRPEAIQSDWVEAEADYAREHGTYVPVFIVPCTLMPPFNRIHTDDLSKWTGEPNDPMWIKLVDRIAKLIGREGLAAAARALATEDEVARYEFARRYRDEPAAAKIWDAARVRFELQMAEAEAVAQAWIDSDREALRATLKEAAPAFDTWLLSEGAGPANGPVPDPLKLIESARLSGDKRLRPELISLQSALLQTTTKTVELEGAKTEIARLSTELAAAFEQVKARQDDLASARAEIALFKEAALNLLTDASKKRSLSQADLSVEAISRRREALGQTGSPETLSEIKTQLKHIQRNSVVFYISTIFAVFLLIILTRFFGRG